MWHSIRIRRLLVGVAAGRKLVAAAGSPEDSPAGNHPADSHLADSPAGSLAGSHPAADSLRSLAGRIPHAGHYHIHAVVAGGVVAAS